MESGLESSFFLTHKEALIHKLQHRVDSLRPYCCSCEPQPLPHCWGLGPGKGGGGREAKEQCMDSEPGCNFIELLLTNTSSSRGMGVLQIHGRVGDGGSYRIHWIPYYLTSRHHSHILPWHLHVTIPGLTTGFDKHCNSQERPRSGL